MKRRGRAGDAFERVDDDRAINALCACPVRSELARPRKGWVLSAQIKYLVSAV